MREGSQAMIITNIPFDKLEKLNFLALKYLQKKAESYMKKEPDNILLDALKGLLDARFYLDIITNIHEELGMQEAADRLAAINNILTDSYGLLLIGLVGSKGLDKVAEFLGVELPQKPSNDGKEEHNSEDLLPY